MSPFCGALLAAAAVAVSGNEIGLMLGDAASAGCQVTEDLGCFKDTAAARLLPYNAVNPGNPTSKITKELCAMYCCADGQSDPPGFPPPGSAVVGVEFGGQCWCGKSFDQSKATKSTACRMKCNGNSSETCGGSNAINVFRATCTGTCKKPPGPPPAPAPPPVGPGFHGCNDPVSNALPYCDTTKTYSERVADIIGRLSLDEKIAMLSPTEAPFCACHTAPLPRLGLPRYKWLTETNSVVDTPCIDAAHCPTTFVGPTGIAASFNRSSWWLKGDIVSTEMRVLNNLGLGGSNQIGLTGFGPNINIVKDPRYGRNSEIPGEDPYLTGEYAVSYVQGCQQVSNKTGDKPFPKMLSYLKHYTAYNVETSRFTFSANVSLYDFWDSYLPQYEAAFTAGGASGAMCSYMAPNGVSSCGNNWLLNELIRGKWGRPDAVVMSDCSAVGNMMKNVMKLNKTQASAQAMNAGLDIYGGWGDDLWGQGFLHGAVNESLTTEATITKAVERTFMQKMKVGLFDPVEGNPWANLGLDDMNSSHAQQVAHEAALQSFVLLKNDARTLPLKLGGSIAVVGPMGDISPGSYNSDYEDAGMPANAPNIADAIAALNGQHGGTTTRATGVAIASSNATGIPAALALVIAADATVLCVGIEKAQEHEGMDRADTLLPGLQNNFSLQVLAAAQAAGKPVVLVTISGGIVSIDDLVDPATAIIDAFNPAQQGPTALAETLFGLANRWGKLPVTIYPGDYAKMQPIQEMSLTSGPGRSHRYYNGTALFTFGSGLSYTDFSLACAKGAGAAGRAAGTDDDGALSFSCTVKNTGTVAGDEVVMVMHSVSAAIKKAADHPVPIQRLVGFDRASLAAGGAASMGFTMPKDRLALTDNTGAQVLYPGQHTLTFTRGHGTTVGITFTISQADSFVRAR